jgi:hypothetical protein
MGKLTSEYGLTCTILIGGKEIAVEYQATKIGPETTITLNYVDGYKEPEKTFAKVTLGIIRLLVESSHREYLEELQLSISPNFLK